jgi:hypothetical protein
MTQLIDRELTDRVWNLPRRDTCMRGTSADRMEDKELT